ncbi:Glycoside hydrolase family 16 protein [Mycena venus]|uniref:Glycoside hydrolase family 16 protein n=1 Tax=Mycena venus TaxID=2733690 RepID=A0A8H6XDE4_9AGAR|nr:Glycoside hydrolase family 16 protein [Mycena venus]
MSRLTKQRNRNSVQSTESLQLTTNSHTSDRDIPLSPPRPFFLAQDSRRNSGSESSLSDSDRENINTIPRVHQQQRRRSAMASASSSYAPVSAASPVTPAFPSAVRRRSLNSSPFDGPDNGYSYAQQSDYAPVGAGAEDAELSPTVGGTWNASNLYYNSDEQDREPPVSPFPFQSHPGNPDPIPRRRSSSLESLTGASDVGPHQPNLARSDTSHDAGLPQPVAPFMQAGDPRHSSSSTSISGLAGSGNSVYRNSAAANMLHPSASQTALNAAYAAGQAGLPMQELGSPNPAFASGVGGTNTPPGTVPRTYSQTFRAPFLSPASRPGSSLWSPPSYPSYPSFQGPQGSHSGSAVALALPPAPAPAPSTRLAGKLTKEEKPWLQRSAPRARVSWWLTFFCMVLGVLGAVALCFFGFEGVDRFTDSELCSVLEDNFDTFDLQNTWTREVQLGGFGNSEFQIASPFDNNSYVQDGELYIMPTLTSAWVGESTVQSGTVTVPSCTEQGNATACTATGNGNDQIVNPVMSARINTQNHYSITYGRVEVRAKLPRGDWLWPAIWMLPTSGTWPLSGEIDIMEARGNSPSYPAQGSNFVRATLQYGPMASLVEKLYGWYGLKRTSFDKGFHTYGMEWDDKWMRFYVDSRIHTVLEISTKNSKSSFWNRAGFPATAQNGSSEVPVTNPYTNNNSPFDQPFYLIIDLAVGGTSGWFPDKVGGKPWFDGSASAMSEFYKDKDTWHATWPTDPADGAFRIDSVKMWKKC